MTPVNLTLPQITSLASVPGEHHRLLLGALQELPCSHTSAMENKISMFLTCHLTLCMTN